MTTPRDVARSAVHLTHDRSGRNAAPTVGGRRHRTPPPSAVDVIERLRNGDVLLFAGGLAFYSLVSAVPSLLLLAWITGSILGEERVESLAERLEELAPGEADVAGP